MVGRYHSWVASFTDFPSEFEITAVDKNNKIMAIEHQSFPIYAVQFHPESILTPNGEQILRNVLMSAKN
jgi:anthranilate synthase component 2